MSEGISEVRGGLILDDARAAEDRVGVNNELRIDLGRVWTGLGGLASVGRRVDASSVMSRLTRLLLAGAGAGAGDGRAILEGDVEVRSASSNRALEFVLLSVFTTGWKRPGVARKADA